mgnify:CR=1 FL=1
MIKKLSKRIFWLITISSSIIIIGIITLFAILNYRNTINTATTMMDRFSNRDNKGKIEDTPNEIIKPNIDGVYKVLIENENEEAISHLRKINERCWIIRRTC